tara:strand:+ start:3495 stop:4709 length:1215 start_codon:yes stop_codon:yes gene_type:complete
MSKNKNKNKKKKHELFIKPPQINSDVINQVEIEMEEGLVSIDDLHFWIDNPRVYSKVQNKVNNITSMSHSEEKEFIYETLIKTKDLDKVKKNIKGDGAINDPLYVARDITGETDRYIVYEGNSRLAVAMLFSRTNEKGVKPWNELKVKKLPDGTSQESIRKIVGAFHMQGKNPWPPFELGGFIYRAVEEEIMHGMPKTKAIEKVSEEFGESVPSVKKHHTVMHFMKDMSPSTQEEQISYWTNFFIGMSTKTLKTFNYKLPIDHEKTKDINNPKEDMLNEAVKKNIDYYLTTPLDKGGAAVGFRKACQQISNSFAKHGKTDIVSAFINGELTMPQAHEAAEEGGVGNVEYEKIKDFKDWITRPDTIKKLQKSTKRYTDLDRFINSIILGCQQASKNLQELREKKK